MGHRRQRRARVFREPEVVSIPGSGGRFEIYIDFELDGMEVVSADVFKSRGIERPDLRMELTAFDVYLAMEVCRWHDYHQMDDERYRRFNDYRYNPSGFVVEYKTLVPLLERIHESLEVPNKAKAEKTEEHKPEKVDNKPIGSIGKRPDREVELFGAIDDLLDQDPLGRNSTNLDPPTR